MDSVSLLTEELTNKSNIKSEDILEMVDKKYSEILENKIEVFRRVTKTNKQIFLAMITPYGINRNEYSDRLVSKEITLDDFFL